MRIMSSIVHKIGGVGLILVFVLCERDDLSFLGGVTRSTSEKFALTREMLILLVSSDFCVVVNGDHVAGMEGMEEEGCGVWTQSEMR